MIFHFAPILGILPIRIVLHLVVHFSHLRAHVRIVMLDQQWQACASAFLRSCSPSGSEQTIAAYQRVLAHFFASRDPQKVTKRDVEDFIYAPANPHREYGATPAPSTRNTRLSVLHSFYKYAATFAVPSAGGPPMPLFRGIAPTVGVRLAKVPHRYRPFTQDELARFFAAIPTDTVIGIRDRAIFLFFFYSGRRRAEIARLLYGDLEETRFPDGKGAMRAGWRYRYIGKGKAGQVTYAELAEPVRLAIWRYLEASGRMDTIASDDPLFLPIGPSVGGGLPIDPYRPMTDGGIYKAMKKYCRMAGLDPRLSPHSFRHTSALMRYQVQPDPRAIQRALGHADLRVTSRYLEELVPTGDEALRLLEEKFGDLL